MQTEIRLMKHYVTNGTAKARVRYSRATLTTGRDCVTIYAKDYGHDLGAVFADSGDYQNDTDLMTDYFDKGRVRIYADSPFWNAACQRAAA